MRIFFLLIFILFSNCLKAKKSPFDFSSPTVFGIGYFISSNQSSSFTIGGKLIGFENGTLIIQLNGGNDIILNPTAANVYNAGNVAKGSAYSLTIKTNPVGEVCGISNSTGIANSNINNADITCSVMTVSATFPTFGANWNDYINRDFSKDIFSQADNTCNLSNSTGYRTCIHGGEIRKFELPSRADCSNLIASDNLDALNWVCRTNSNGSVTFYSSGLKRGKYLSTLIDWTNNTWQNLTITVKDGNTSLAVSNPIKLWTNQIDTTAPNIANTSGKVYLYSSNVTTGDIRVNVSDKVALVFKPGTIYTISGGTGCSNPTITVSTNFNWIEGTIATGNNSYNKGVIISSKYNVFKNVRIQSIGNGCASVASTGIELTSSLNNYFEDVIVSNVFGGAGPTHVGVSLSSGSNYNTFQNLLVYNTNLGLSVSSTNNSFINISTLNNTLAGIGVYASDNQFFNILSMNNTSVGVDLNGAPASKNLLINVALINNSGGGLQATSSSGNTILNFGSIFNAVASANLNNASDNKFTGIFKKGNSGADICSVSGGSNTGVLASGTCSQTTPSDFGTAIVVTDISSVFSGVTATGDTTNTDNEIKNTGTDTIGGITDWLNFNHFFRSIGLTGVSFPASANRGRCSSGNCNVWDFSLKSTDTVLKNINSCPTSSSTMTHLFNSGTTSVFLRNAIEILNDGVGNENGLCEANEDCLYTPNISSYQGHGNLVTALKASGCADISSPAIKLYQNESNGY